MGLLHNSWVLIAIQSINMQQFIKIARSLPLLATLITAVWCVTLAGVAVGSIDVPQQSAMLIFVTGREIIFCWQRERSRGGAIL
jgi:hypothetical protein